MFYVILAVFAGLVFLLCWALDRLIKRLFPKDLRKAVGLPRRSLVFGTLLMFLALSILLGFWEQMNWGFRAGCGLIMLMGLFLLIQYFSFSIRYDEDGFTCRSLGKKPFSCPYEDILGQRSLLTRSGVNSTLYTRHGEVPIFSAQENVKDFLKTAFAAWCKATGTDPDSVENNPAYLVYFPDIKE